VAYTNAVASRAVEALVVVVVVVVVQCSKLAELHARRAMQYIPYWLRARRAE
jgi:hypothetical protein